MGTPNDLYNLQKLDTSLLDLRRQLNETQIALQDPADLVAARKRKETLTSSSATVTASVTDKELEIGTLQTKLNRSTERLYSGKVKNPKELEDLQKEVDSLNGRKDDHELDLMELMETQETNSADLKETENRLAGMETTWREKSQQLRIQQGEIALKMKGLLGKRKEQAPKINSSVLSQYQKMVQSKGGLGIVKLDGRSCTGCKIGMDGGTVRQVNGGKLGNCPNCGRFLIRG